LCYEPWSRHVLVVAAAFDRQASEIFDSLFPRATSKLSIPKT
jgi:hypothetical protein